MLKITKTLTDTPQITFNVIAEEDSSQREDIYRKLLGDAAAASINPIFDNEVSEFKPQDGEVNFYIYFSAFNNTDWLEQLKPNVEESFSFHLEESVRDLSSQAKKTVTNPKTFLQHIGVPVPKALLFYQKTAQEILRMLPQVVLDPVEVLTNVTPTKEGIPVFYNSFALPYTKNLEKWGDERLGFSNKSFLYNSFLLMDFYTTNNPLTQKKIMSIPVYVNGRYMGQEVNTKGIKQMRPALYLNNDTEGYSIVWLRKHKLEQLYVRFSFWDALNGEQITLLPSSIGMGEKKWVQNPNTFHQENLYLEYKFNYGSKTYVIHEYNSSTGKYDIATNTFDLYQLVYDEYFAKLKRVVNSHPVRDGVSSDLGGEDIALGISKTSLSIELDAPFDNNEKALASINKMYNVTQKSIFGIALHDLFQKAQVKLKDKALVYFESKFNGSSFYSQTIGSLTLTNTTDKNLLIRRIDVRNVKVENKNSFIDGETLVTNQYEVSTVDSKDSYHRCNTFFTFVGSSFYRKLNPIRAPYDALETAIYNKQAEMYSNFYYDEENNKVVERKSEDVAELVATLSKMNKDDLVKSLLTGTFGVIKYFKEHKQQEARIKGLAMNEKDLNLMLRSDILEKSGAKAKYELLFPATQDKIAHNTSNYQEFGVSIKTTLSPQYDEFSKGLTVGLKTDVIFGKEFFKLFISGNDDIIITYDVAVSFVDENGIAYKKIIPCKIKYT